MDGTTVEDRATPTPANEERPRRRGRGWRRAVVVLLALAVAGTATVAVLGPQRGDAARTSTADGLPPETTTVTRQTLTDTLSVDGELGHGPTTTTTNRLPGTFTGLPETGTRVARGETLYEVDGAPVTLMYGAVPAYRTLEPGVEGRDVRQLEENLRALGYTGFTVDEEYTSATASAVERWQEDRGLPRTGEVELGRVVFTPAAVRVDGLGVAEGDPATPGQRVLTHTGTARAVTVELEAADQRLAGKGSAVTVTFPDGGRFGGRVDQVTTVIRAGEAPGEEPRTVVEVVVTLTDEKAQKAAEPYVLASVDVAFTAERREDVLTVPVAALVALAEGGFGVEVVTGSTTRYVPVRTGLFADGRVEVSGDGITEGTVVGMPR